MSLKRKTVSRIQISNKKLSCLLSQIRKQKTNPLKKFQNNFSQQFKMNANGFPQRYRKTKKRIYSENFFFGISKKMEIPNFYSFNSTAISRQQK